MRPDGPRDPVAGPNGGPEAPYPIKMYGPVIRGFGRGGKEVSQRVVLMVLSRLRQTCPVVANGHRRKAMGTSKKREDPRFHCCSYQ